MAETDKMGGAPTTITVEAKVVGQRQPLISGWRVPMPDLTDPGAADGTHPRTLRHILAAVVRAQVASFRERQEAPRLTRVLSPTAIAAAAARGKIDAGGAYGDKDAPDVLDDNEAVRVALQAFADGVYFVFLDGVQVEDLATPVVLSPTSTLTFIRLVALAGG